MRAKYVFIGGNCIHMRQHIVLRAACVAALPLFVMQARAGTADAAPLVEALCRDWFGPEAKLEPLALFQTNMPVHEVTLEGRPHGWLFRTDQIPPACKGKRGEIVLLVGIGTDARIKGLHVLAHKEDTPYFKRLKHEFFDQFINRPANGQGTKIDAVTRATLSSTAIIREVLEGAKNVAALPEVAAKMAPSAQCSLTDAPIMSHNKKPLEQGNL